MYLVLLRLGTLVTTTMSSRDTGKGGSKSSYKLPDAPKNDSIKIIKYSEVSKRRGQEATVANTDGQIVIANDKRPNMARSLSNGYIPIWKPSSNHTYFTRAEAELLKSMPDELMSDVRKYCQQNKKLNPDGTWQSEFDYRMNLKIFECIVSIMSIIMATIPAEFHAIYVAVNKDFGKQVYHDALDYAKFAVRVYVFVFFVLLLCIVCCGMCLSYWS